MGLSKVKSLKCCLEGEGVNKGISGVKSSSAMGIAYTISANRGVLANILASLFSVILLLANASYFMITSYFRSSVPLFINGVCIDT